MDENKKKRRQHCSAIQTIFSGQDYMDLALADSVLHLNNDKRRHPSIFIKMGLDVGIHLHIYDWVNNTRRICASAKKTRKSKIKIVSFFCLFMSDMYKLKLLKFYYKLTYDLLTPNFNNLVQLHPRYEGQLNQMANFISHPVLSPVRSYDTHHYLTADGRAETDRYC